MHIILKTTGEHITSQTYSKDPEQTRNYIKTPTIYHLPPGEASPRYLSLHAGAQELQSSQHTDTNQQADPKLW